jgi:hypothetical protein
MAWRSGHISGKSNKWFTRRDGRTHRDIWHDYYYCIIIIIITIIINVISCDEFGISYQLSCWTTELLLKIISLYMLMHLYVYLKPIVKQIAYTSYEHFNNRGWNFPFGSQASVHSKYRHWGTVNTIKSRNHRSLVTPFARHNYVRFVTDTEEHDITTKINYFMDEAALQLSLQVLRHVFDRCLT